MKQGPSYKLKQKQVNSEVKKRKLNTSSFLTGSKQAWSLMWQAVILQLPMGDWKQQELWYFHVNHKQSFELIFLFLKHFIPQGPSS